MKRHEPECYYGEPVRGGHILDCICERLRACRERTLDEVHNEVVMAREFVWLDSPDYNAYSDIMATIEALKNHGVSST